MIIAEFYNNQNKKMNYLYQTKDGQIITYALDKDGLQEFDKEEIINLINDLKLNKRCFKVRNYRNYEIYLDPKYNIKHFLRNGIEDFNMFYRINFYDATFYKSKKNQKKKHYFLKGVILGTFTVVLASSFTTGHLNTELIQNAITYSKINVLEDYIDVSSINGISTQEIIDLIQTNPNLTDEEKNDFIKEDFFNDIISRYENSFMKFELYQRLNDLKIEYYHEEKKDENVCGYYNYIVGKNILHVRDDLDYESTRFTKIHELAHAFQNQNQNKYRVIIEAVNELMAAEYFYSDEIPHTYTQIINNIELLMDIIGPEPVLQICYNGDDSLLVETLKNNLSEEDYIILNNYLKSDQTIDNNYDSKIKEILQTLYKNIYNQDIRKDSNILYNIYYDSKNTLDRQKKFYFNKRKMEENKIPVTVTYDLADESWYKVTKSTIIRKLVSTEYYYNHKDDKTKTFSFNPMQFNYITMYGNENYIKQFMIDEEGNSVYGEEIPIDEAIQNNMVNIYETKTIKYDDKLPDGWEYVPSLESDRNEYRLIEPLIENAETAANSMTIIPQTISERFKNQEYIIEDSNNKVLFELKK